MGIDAFAAWPQELSDSSGSNRFPGEPKNETIRPQLHSSGAFLKMMTAYALRPLVKLVQEFVCGQRGRPNSNVVSVYYHCVSDERLKHLKYLYRYKNVRQFNQDLEILVKAFEPITIDEFLRVSASGGGRRKPAVLITFDDGLREVYDVVAPILLMRGIPATFFVTRDFVDNRFLCYHHRASLIVDKLDQLPGDSRVSTERDLRKVMYPGNFSDGDVRKDILRAAYSNRPLIDEVARAFDVDCDAFLESSRPYLTSDQLRKLADWGFGLGGHSLDHCHYPRLPLEEQLRQTEESVTYLKKALQLKYGVFSFPHGEGGVSQRFFECLGRRGEVDWCFGTRGFVRDDQKNLHQRLSMETPLLGAEKALMRHLFRAFGKALIGRGAVSRA